MLNEYFGLSEKHTTLKIEIVAGLTTFLTMAYIVFVNPSILSLEGIELTDIERMDKQALIAVTCLVSGLATIIVGIFAKAPIAMAPGMGLNAFFAYLVSSGKMDWQTALGVVFLSGLFFLILTLLGLRKRLVEAIPESLVSAIAVGIGLFITFMGLVKLGIVVSDEHTLVKAGPLNATVLIGLFGLLVMVFCEMKKIRGGLVAGILASTLLAGLFGRIEMPERFISLDMNLRAVSLQLDILGALKWSFFGSIFTLMFIDMFDSVGTLVACCHQADMVNKENRIEGLDRLLGIDAIATMIGALFGSRLDDAEMDVVRLGRFDASQIEQLERDRFEQALFTAVQVVSLLNDCGKVEFIPLRVVLVAVVITGLEFVPTIEVELPHVLAHGVAPDATTGSITNVVVDVAVVDERPIPQIVAAGVAAAACRVGNELRVFVVLACGDQLIDRHTFE